MVAKGDLLRSIKLYKVNKTQSFEFIFEAIINNALLFDVNNVKYDPSEAIYDLINLIWEEPLVLKKILNTEYIMMISRYAMKSLEKV